MKDYESWSLCPLGPRSSASIACINTMTLGGLSESPVKRHVAKEDGRPKFIIIYLVFCDTEEYIICSPEWLDKSVMILWYALAHVSQ